MKRFLLFALAVVFTMGVVTARAQDSKRTPEPAGDKVKVEDTHPQKFDIFFKIHEEKFDTNTVKPIVTAMMLRLNSTQLNQNKDYQVFVGHDTVQVRFLNNKRDISDWFSLLVRQGVLRIHLANDSTYFKPTDSLHVPKDMMIVPEPDGKTKHYVSDRILNGQLLQLSNSIESFDSPALTGVVVPKDTNYKSFLFTKGMRFAIVVDGVVYTSGASQADSLALNTFPLMTQYPAPLTYIMDRVIRYPYVASLDYLGWRKTEEK